MISLVRLLNEILIKEGGNVFKNSEYDAQNILLNNIQPTVNSSFFFESDKSNNIRIGYCKDDIKESDLTYPIKNREVIVNYYRTDTDVKVLTASSAENTNGNFQYWNGSSWINGIGPNIVGARRRFVPNQSLSISQDVYAKIKVL
jgi:hypothetical protein